MRSVCLLALVVSIPVALARPATVGQGRSFVEVQPHPGAAPSIRIVNQRFDVVQVLSRQLLLDETIETVQQEGIEAPEVEKVVLRASELAASAPRRLFEFTEKGLRTAVLYSELYAVGAAVCCASNPSHAVRSLINGKRLFFTGGWDPVILRLTGLEKDDSGRKGPSTGYVGVHAPGTARDKEVYGHGASGLLITYASNTEPRDAVLVVVNDSVDELRVTEARWVRRAKTMWTPRDLTETEAELAAHPPVVEVTLMNLGRMRVPLRKQRFAEREAELPPGLRIQRVPLPGP